MKIMIIGAGKLGYRLAETMMNEQIDITLVDTNQKTIERVQDHLDVLAVMGNGLDMATLKELSIETYDMLIAVTGVDEANTIICSIAKKLGVRRTIARIRNPEYIRQKDYLTEDMGIDHIVNPDLATAHEIMRFLMKGYHFHTGDFAKGKVTMMDIKIGQIPDLIGKKIMNIENFDGLLITAIKREGVILIPDGSTVLKAEDLLYILGKTHRLNEFVKRFKLCLDVRPVKDIMIFGGGNIGFYLANDLIRQNVNVVIVEQNRDRCYYLSNKLPEAVVIHGDGTDLQLLEEESLAQMDAFVGATGFDEQNLLMAIMAKQEGVDKTIAKISRSSYVNLIDKLNIDFSLNPIDITVSEILKYVRGGLIVSVTMLLERQAEVVEVIVNESLACVNEKIKDLKLPKGIIIGAILHNHQVIIPNGDTVIHAGDRLVIFSLNSSVEALQQFIRPNDGGLLRELWNRTKGPRKTAVS
ncbi:Trk system potassium transporter TrkA [Acidaminobacter hydrogenoformans]|uniref:Trk system potassium uptake protein TrkA n=1 Tax=Acidaminobacter hydrogenoformans DSM 2784 TaxID=1120920 RepID=A0A1G5S5L7_9FIRM|nr:Trk system potassium transporter TrkA [Acidaminobacter hydrogenoformans]SCZ81160.1 trk system potassium uptake protein TrkA [Acidaminobacter hydrogenoformans DSM 2784]